MALFGGSKSNVSNIVETQNAGFSEIAGPAVAIQGEGNAVTLTDQGALAVAQSIVDRALEQVELAGARTAQTVSQSVAAVAEAGRAETENITRDALRYATYAAVAIAALYALGRIFGK